MKVKVINQGRHPLPEYQTVGAAAFDVCANIDEPVTLGSLERALVPTGLFFALPEGYEMQIRPRSGLAAKHGISIVNSPGTLDSDYRGELKIVLVNLSKESYTFEDGDRIAQVVVAPFGRVEWEVVEALDATDRGHNGMGSTGR